MIVLLTPGGFEQLMPAMKDNPTSDIPALAARFGMQIVGSQIDRATVSQQQIA
jgi:hypothetical protein